MPSLYNPTPYPANARRCYWDAEHIASQSFCITSKLTDQEAKQIAEFEEQKFWERNEQLKTQLGYSQVDLEPVVYEISIEQKAILEISKMRADGSLDLITSKLSPDFHQKIDKLCPDFATNSNKLEEDFFLNHAKKINKLDYLTR